MEGFPWGGSEELWARAAEELLSKGHRVSINVKFWNNPADGIKKLIQKGASVYFRNIRSVKSRIATRLKGQLDHPHFWSEIDKSNVDIVCISCGDTYDISGKPALVNRLKSEGVAYIIISQFHEENAPLPLERRLLIANFFNKAKKIVFVAQRNLEVAKRNLISEFQQALVIYNPIKVQIRQIPFPPKKLFSVASVARLECKVKNQDLLLDCFRDPIWITRNWHLNLYGTGPDKAYLEELIKYWKLDKHVTLHDHVEFVEEIWRTNHLLILPSSGEGSSLALQEAMACGRPAIVSDVGGNTELTEDNVSGFVMKGISRDNLQEALLHAYDRLNELESMGLKAIDRIKEIHCKPSQLLLSEILLNN